jgi:hypothetical protein
VTAAARISSRRQATPVRRTVIGPVAHGFDPGDLAPAEKAIRAGAAYANIHTTKFPAGEIRGQIRRGHGERHR